jgi:hypothetical protein
MLKGISVKNFLYIKLCPIRAYPEHKVNSREELNMTMDDDLRYWMSLVETENMVTPDYIKKYIMAHDGRPLHQDYVDYIDTFKGFRLYEEIPVSSIKSDLEGLDSEKVDRYRTMDLAKAPPIVLGDGYILDGYHRVNAVKAAKLPYIKGYVGIK